MGTASATRPALPSGRRTSRAAIASVFCAALVVSFVLNQTPFAFSRHPRTLGVDGDSWFHVAIQMRLADPTKFPGDLEVSQFYLQGRPASEYLIHRIVGVAAEGLLGGDFVLANIVGHWLITATFLGGCLALGLLLGEGLGAASLFTFACAGISLAPRTSWGLPFGGVIPHDVGLAIVPWATWACLRAESTRAQLAVFFALGLAANVYALTPFLLAVVLLGTSLLTTGSLLRVLAQGAAFTLGASPIIVLTALPAVARLGSAAATEPVAFARLIQRHYWYLVLPTEKATTLIGQSPVWWLLAIGLIGLLGACRHRKSCRALAVFGVIAAIVTVTGFFVGRFAPSLLPFLLHRAGAFLYIPAYGGLAILAAWCWRRHAALRIAAVLLAAIIVGASVKHTSAWQHWYGGMSADLSEDYLALAAWARRDTPAESTFLIPMFSRTSFYAFRVLAERAAYLHRSVGELVIINPKAARSYLEMADDIEPLTARPCDTSQWVRVARRYDADYIIVEAATPYPPSLRVVYRNSSFTVFESPEGE